MLSESKEDHYPFFTNSNKLEKPIHRTTLNLEVNKYLKELGEKTGKKLSAHSYRITLVTKVNSDQSK